MAWNKLLPGEVKWVKLQSFLESRGYCLRRRYNPNWKPPRKKNDKDETTIDSVSKSVIQYSLLLFSVYKQLARTALDAVRKLDYSRVVLKITPTNSNEVPIHSGTLLSLKNWEKYFSPIYDIILLPDSDEECIPVLPLLLDIKRVRFENVYELLDCILNLTEVRYI